MRELFSVAEESTPQRLVLRDADTDERFFVVLPDELAGTTPAAPGSDDDPANAAPRPAAGEARATMPESRPRLPLRPREIQERVRAGASTAELAREMGVPEGRVEPFAYPVLQERAQMAETAKRAFPIIGPDELTRAPLYEVLAGSFASIDKSLSEAVWDSYRGDEGRWIARVSWRAGLGDAWDSAEWTIIIDPSGQPTAEARDGLAADLIDPDFIKPVRTLTPVDNDLTRTRDDLRPVPDYPDEETPDHAAEQAEGTSAESRISRSPSPSQRRRRPTTPNWEDVLLGVRTSTKRSRK